LLSFLRDDLAEEVLGDLDEKFYATLKNKSLFRAKLNYWYQVFNYLRPFAIRKFQNLSINQNIMLKNYLTISWRNLLKNKAYLVINTIGLGISLACCVTVYLLLAYNIEFDSFHDSKKVSRIFRFHTLSKDREGKVVCDVQAPIVLAPIAAEQIAGIERYARFLYGGGALRYQDKAFNEGMAFTDSSFFDLFDYPLQAGSHKFFKDKNSIFLSEKLAKKYFGDEDPIGKLMVLTGANETEIELLVGGVVKRFPTNNTFTFNALIRIENFMAMHKIKDDDWSDWRNPSTFVQISDEKNAATISKAMSKYIAHRNEVRPETVVNQYELVPFKSNYTFSDIRMSWVNHRRGAAPLIVFSSLALLILLIACFNLTNTSIAMTARRLKEVGIRKSVGAVSGQIIRQFLFETLIIISLSLIVGLLLAQILIPAFTTMWQLEYSLADLNGLNMFIAIIALVFLASLLAGIYPALFSSKFKPAALLKGAVKVKGTNMLTRSLVALQFALSVIVLIAGVVFIQNTKFQDSIQFGYDKDKVITVTLQGEKDYEAIRNAIASHPKILSVGVSDGNIGSSSYQTPVRIDTARYEVQALGIGFNYFETMGLRFAEGRDFNLENASDEAEGVIVNRALVELIGISDPIDKVIFLHDKPRRILGIVDNHVDDVFRSNKAEPFVFYPAGRYQYINLVVKAEKQDLQEVEKYLEATWKQVFPTKPYESRYQDDLVLEESRIINKNLQQTFLFITVLGAILSGSGIYSLASLNIARRTKEIGIRKALGASINNIVGLLNKEFAIVLLIASLLGSVSGYYLTNALLDEIYAYHIQVGIVPIIACALAIFVIGIIATSSTILGAARSNPVDTLRSE
jgi:putative ABC transport system permease protein